MKQMNLVHMGDSITFGQYVDASLRWTTLIQNKISKHFDENNLKVTSFNRGISGETTRMGLLRYPQDVQQLNPTLMTLQFGLNDCNCWETDGGLPRVSPRSYKSNLIEMIGRARHFGAKHIILGTNHRTLKRNILPGGDVYEDRNLMYSSIAREVAKETEVELFDIQKEFIPFDDNQLLEMLLPEPDLLHLSIKGNEFYAEKIWPYVQRALERLNSI